MNKQFFTDLTARRRNGGTFTLQGVEFTPKCDVVTLACKTVSGDLLPEELAEVVEDFVDPSRTHRDFCVGFYRMESGEISIDLNVCVSPYHRANTLLFARQNGQEAIWDGVNGGCIATGGDGVAKLGLNSTVLHSAAVLLSAGCYVNIPALTRVADLV